MEANKPLPFDIVELVNENGPTPEPITMTRYSGGQATQDIVTQVAGKMPLVELEENFEIRSVNVSATHFRPFRMQFTPSASASGGPPREYVDVALQGEYRSCRRRSSCLVNPSVFTSKSYPRPTTHGWPTPSVEERHRGLETSTLPVVSYNAPLSPEDDDDVQLDPPTSTLPVMPSFSAPIAPENDHGVKPDLSSSANPRSIKRSGAFYHKSHPKIYWQDSWGEKPKDDETVTVEDRLPPWAMKELARMESSAEKDKGKAKAVVNYEDEAIGDNTTPSESLRPALPAKGKAKAVESNESEAVADNAQISGPEGTSPPTSPYKLRSRKPIDAPGGSGISAPEKAALAERSTSGRWVGLTKTLRSVAAAMSGASGSRDAHREAGSSSSSTTMSRLRGKKRRRGNGEDENAEEEPPSGRKKVKRGGRK